MARRRASDFAGHVWQPEWDTVDPTTGFPTRYEGYSIPAKPTFGGQADPPIDPNHSGVEAVAAKIDEGLKLDVTVENYDRHQKIGVTLMDMGLTSRAFFYDDLYQYLTKVHAGVKKLHDAEEIDGDHPYVQAILPRLIEVVRVSLMGPEANQVNAICFTQPGRQAQDLCRDSYTACRNRGGTSRGDLGKRFRKVKTDGNGNVLYGQVNVETADRECVQYLKDKVFVGKREGDARDIPELFQTWPYLQTHDSKDAGRLLNDQWTNQLKKGQTGFNTEDLTQNRVTMPGAREKWGLPGPDQYKVDTSVAKWGRYGQNAFDVDFKDTQVRLVSEANKGWCEAYPDDEHCGAP